MEELKTVLEIIARMSGDAASLGTWWIVLHYGIKALEIIAFAIAVPACVYLVTRAIWRYNVADRALSEIADIVGHKSFYSYYVPDVRKLIDTIRAGRK